MEHECVTFASRWQALRGMAYGLRQTTILGSLRVVISAPPNFSVLDQVMSKLLDEATPDHLLALHSATSLVQRILHIQATIQRQQKIPVFSTGHAHVVAKGGSPPKRIHHYSIALPYFHPQATLSTLRWIRLSLNQLVAPNSFSDQTLLEIHSSYEGLLSDLRKFSVRGTNIQHFLSAAFDLGIPSSRLTPDIFTFGEGSHCRWLKSTMTDQTAAIAVQLSGSKMASAHVLRQHGLPTPRHQKVANTEQALLVAEKLGYPVVVKPDDQEQGRGVAAGLRKPESIRKAVEAALSFSKNILVESFHEGQDYRLTTFQGKVVKILHRRAGGVVGNGKGSILELLEQEKQTPDSRRIFRQTGKVRLTLDDEALELICEQNLTPQAVPISGHFVPLRRKCNISAGGVFSLIQLQDCHPDNYQLAIRAADALRLDPCGVDLIIPDISRSWLETGAVIIEMNAMPQLGFSQGPETYPQMLREMIKANGSIPKHLLICLPNVELPSPSTLTELPAVASFEGLSMPQGVWIKGKRTTLALGNGFKASQILLRDKSIHSAFCVMSSNEIIEQGLPAEHFDRITCLHATDPSKENVQLLDEIRSRVSANTNQLDVLQDITRLES